MRIRISPSKIDANSDSESTHKSEPLSRLERMNRNLCGQTKIETIGKYSTYVVHSSTYCIECWPVDLQERKFLSHLYQRRFNTVSLKSNLIS